MSVSPGIAQDVEAAAATVREGMRHEVGCLAGRYGPEWNNECSCGFVEARAALRLLVAQAEQTAELRAALEQAIAEIEGCPYDKESWGWGMAYRMRDWKNALARGGGRTQPDGGDA